MIFRLRRPSEDRHDGRMREVHAPEEVMHPVYDDAQRAWLCECRSGSTVAALARRGCVLVEEVVEPRDLGTPHHSGPALPARGRKAQRAARVTGVTAGATAADAEPVVDRAARVKAALAPDPSSPRAALLAWQSTRGRERALPRGTASRALAVTRAPFGRDESNRLATVARDAAPSLACDLAVVMVLHGWADRDQDAVTRALDACALLGRCARVVAVQNHAPSAAAFRAWRPHRAGKLTRVVVPNEGFGAACEAGRLAAARSAWHLYTQADCRWGALAARQAVALAIAGARDGIPATVGPSGGYTSSWREPAFCEAGRNIGDTTSGPRPVDWVAGYWLLAQRDALAQVGGWPTFSFMYAEEPDLCARLAATGSRPLSWAALAVDHDRGGTVKRVGDGLLATDAQADAHQRFSARWGNAPDPLLPSWAGPLGLDVPRGLHGG